MKKKFYIVTSIPYANGNPHMGHTLDALYGDVLNRYYRMNDKDSVLQVGIDENGQKVYQKARSEKIPIEDWLKKIRPVFLNFEKKMGIDYQIFTQTSDKKEHFPAAIEMWKRAQKKGDIYKKNYKGLYCVGCEAFVAENDLVDGKCPDHQTKPELLEEENYFFALSKYRKFLKNHFDKNKDFVQPKNYYHEAYNLIDKLEDVSISRPKERLPWGVPVPGDDTHVMYVWFDALINYLSGVGFPGDLKKFNKHWPADIEIIGKDNNRWHSLLWPTMLKSAGLKLPKIILVHGFITAKGGIKMSKTIGNVVDPVEMIDKYGTDAFRYYLLSRVPLDNDGAFDEEMFRGVYNSDLAGGLGNLFQRTLIMINKYKLKIEKNPKKPWTNTAISKKEFLGVVFKEVKQFRFNVALKNIWTLIQRANIDIDKSKPWELYKTDTKELVKTMQLLYESLQAISEAIYPFMPEASERMKKQLKSLRPEPLFPRLDK